MNVGSYCGAGATSATGIPCPIHTFGTLVGAINASSCQACASGTFTMNAGVTTCVSVDLSGLLFYCF